MKIQPKQNISHAANGVTDTTISPIIAPTIQSPNPLPLPPHPPHPASIPQPSGRDRFSALPLETRAQILRYLSTADMICAGMTSKQWRETMEFVEGGKQKVYLEWLRELEDLWGGWFGSVTRFWVGIGGYWCLMSRDCIGSATRIYTLHASCSLTVCGWDLDSVLCRGE